MEIILKRVQYVLAWFHSFHHNRVHEIFSFLLPKSNTKSELKKNNAPIIFDVGVNMTALISLPRCKKKI